MINKPKNSINIDPYYKDSPTTGYDSKKEYDSTGSPPKRVNKISNSEKNVNWNQINYDTDKNFKKLYQNVR